MRVRTDRPQTRQVEVRLLAIRLISQNDDRDVYFVTNESENFYSMRGHHINKSIVTRIKS